MRSNTASAETTWTCTPASAEAGEGWTGPILMAPAESPVPADGGWEQAGRGQTGWDVSAPTPSGGWGGEPAMDASDSPGEALPPDAILGTAPILGPAEESSDGEPPQQAVPAWEEAQRQAAELLGNEGTALLDKAAKKLRQAKAQG